MTDVDAISSGQARDVRPVVVNDRCAVAMGQLDDRGGDFKEGRT